MSNAIDG
jgi:hypothetical protein